MEKEEWCERLRTHYATACIIPSTLRGQTEKGSIDEARKYIKNNVFLYELVRQHATTEKFSRFLDFHTERMAGILIQPKGAKQAGESNFGAARKVINIFLRLCCMNKDLNRFYNLEVIEPLLEVPLDKYVVEGINRCFDGTKTSGFTIRDLTPNSHTQYQEKATIVAEKEGVKRYELDVLFLFKS